MIQSYIPPTAINGGLAPVDRSQNLTVPSQERMAGRGKLWRSWRSGWSQAISGGDGAEIMEVVLEMVVGEGGGGTRSRGERGQAAGMVWGGGAVDVVRMV
jgi:hypothetical protein